MTERWHLGTWLHDDEIPFVLVEERPVPRNKHQVVQNAGNCREMSIPIQAWHIHKIVASVIELSEQSSERRISTLKKWNKLNTHRV